MRTILIALMMTLATQAGAEGHMRYWYEDRIKAFQCDVEMENPTIFYKEHFENKWTLPVMSVIGLNYEVEQKGEDKFIARHSDAQIFFNLKKGEWSRTIVKDGEVTENDCKDVSELVATVATSIFPFVEKDTSDRLSNAFLEKTVLEAALQAYREALDDALKQITKMKYLVSQAMDLTLSSDELDKVKELQREGYIK